MAKIVNTNDAQLPAAVLHEIFCNSPLIVKFQCERVCKSWRSILTCPSQHQGSEVPVGIWGTSLNLLLDQPLGKTRGMTVGGLEDGRPSVCFIDDDTALLTREQSLIEWLGARAPGFQSVLLAQYEHSNSWLFPRLLLALTGRGSSGRRTPAVTLCAGGTNANAVAEIMHECSCSNIQRNPKHRVLLQRRITA